VPTGPLFSVVIPTYNRPEFLAQAIASVCTQTVDDFEIVVVDNGSDPPTEIEGNPRARVVRIAGNRGAAAARNTGLDAARGEYVAFLDDDDVFTADRLELALEGLSRAAVAICWSRFADRPPGHHRVLEGDVGDEILNGLTPSLGATAIRRAVAPRFDERLDAVEDIDWWLRVARSQPVATVARIGHLVRRHGGPRHGNAHTVRVVENLAYLETHADYFARHRAAAGFRWKRIGLLALRTGDRRLARKAFRRSLRLTPQPATVKHLIRAIGASRAPTPRVPKIAADRA
jgi:glycosyltransferase involved in cell wall biosynthesis